MMMEHLTFPDACNEAGLITRDEAARRLDVSTKTLRRMIEEGKVPGPVSVHKRRQWFHAGDIDEAIRRLAGLAASD